MEVGMERLRDRVRPFVAMTEGIYEADMGCVENLVHALFPPSKELPCPDDGVVEHFSPDSLLAFFSLAASNQANWGRLETIALQVNHPVFATKLLDLVCRERFAQKQLTSDVVSLLEGRVDRWMEDLGREHDLVPPEVFMAKVRAWYWRHECDPFEEQASVLEGLLRLMREMQRVQKLARDRDRVRCQAIACLLDLGWDDEAKGELGYMEDAIGMFEGNLAMAEAFMRRQGVPVGGLASGSYRQEPEEKRWKRYYRAARDLHSFHEHHVTAGTTHADLAEWRSSLLRAQLRMGLDHDAEQTAATIHTWYDRAEHVYPAFIDRELTRSKGDPARLLQTFAHEVQTSPSGELVFTDLGLLETRVGLTFVRNAYKAWKQLEVPIEMSAGLLRRALRAEDGITAQVLFVLLPAQIRRQLLACSGWDQQEFALANVSLGQVERLYPGSNEQNQAERKQQTPPVEAESV